MNVGGYAGAESDPVESHFVVSIVVPFNSFYSTDAPSTRSLPHHRDRNDARGANVGGTVTFFNTHSKVLSVSAHHDDGQQKHHNLIAGEENFNFAGNKNMARDSPVELIK